jgi:hypothetical protein
MNSTSQENNMSEPDPAFTLFTLWREISQAAQAKNAFHQDDYDEHGNINFHLDKFKELYNWLVCASMAVVRFQFIAANLVSSNRV